MSTYGKFAAVSLTQQWQELRALRAQQIGRARTGDRKETVNAALEQAEQLFSAAQTVGTATQPILLFYGLSQLGRAITATSNRISNDEYKFTAHGIKAKDLNGVAKQGLAALEVQGLDRGAFPVVAKALGASGMRNWLQLGKIWGLIPSSERFPLPGAGGLQWLVLEPEQSWIMRDVNRSRGSLFPLPVDLQTSVTDPTAPVQSVGDDVIDEERTLLQTFLARYPTLTGWQLPDSVQPIPYQHRISASVPYLELTVNLPQPEDLEDGRAGSRVFTEYHDTKYVYPKLDSTELAGHPLLLWWAVLHALSQVARYEPTAWLHLTSVSKSASAVPIEHILREGIQAIPELAYAAIVEGCES